MPNIKGNVGGNFDINKGGKSAASAPPKRQAPSKPAGHAELSGQKNKVSDSGGATKRARVDLPKAPDLKEITKPTDDLAAKAAQTGANTGHSMVADMKELNDQQNAFTLQMSLMQQSTKFVDGLAKQISKTGQGVKDLANG